MPARRPPLLRSRPRDAERTREVIMIAATEAFATLGPGGARMDAIAERAGIDKRLIYYYFGNKDDLFQAVIENAYRTLREAEGALDLDGLAPRDGMRRIVEFIWRHFLAHPDFLALFANENLQQAAHVKRSARLREMPSPVVARVRELLARGGEQGVFRGDVDAEQLYISIAGESYFYLANQHTLSAALGRDLGTRKALDARLEHVVEVILGYLRP